MVLSVKTKSFCISHIDTPGFYYVDGKIVTSEIGIYPKLEANEDIKKMCRIS